MIAGGAKLDFPSRIFTPEDLAMVKPTYEEKMHAAEAILSHFVKLAGKVSRPSYEELYAECDELQRSVRVINWYCIFRPIAEFPPPN